MFMLKTHKRLFLVTVISFLLVSSSCGGIKPPPWSEITKDDPVVKQKSVANVPETSDDLVVYLDTSKSMAGYVSGNPERLSIFSHTLLEVRNVSTMLTPPLNVFVRRVSAEVSGSLNETYLNEASVKPGLFDGAETNISGAIDSFSLSVESRATRNSESNANQQPTQASARDEDLKPPARFHILITDGVQSLKNGGDESCAVGSDQVCVRKKILALLNKGWAGYVIGIRSEFKGKLYSEITHAVLPYETVEPESFRPFYLYLFSPDHVALDRLQAALRERLKGFLPNEDSLRLVALTSGYSDGFGQSDLQIPKTQGDLLAAFPGTENKPSRTTLKVSLATENGSPQPFTIVAHINWSDSVKQSGTPEELARFVKWNLAEVYSSSAQNIRLPALNLTSVESQFDGSVRLGLTAQWPKANGEPAWRGYRLEGRLKLDEQVPSWVKQWSCDLDTSVAMGSRTLFLESALLGLWRNSEIEKQVVHETYLLVGKK